MPIINDEFLGKVVGRRQSSGRIGEVGSTIASKRGWARLHGRPLVPKGVYRFTSHEEAELWDEENDGAPGDLEPREPSDEDLVNLCRELNRLDARYIVVGGFAVRAAGYIRATTDIDLLVDTTLENETRIFKALELLLDKAVLELEPGEVERYSVVRVADEVVVDLMKSACGIDFARGHKNIVTLQVNGVSIPFASPTLLWHMKIHTRRTKDEGDIVFLRDHFQRLGLNSPPPLAAEE